MACTGVGRKGRPGHQGYCVPADEKGGMYLGRRPMAGFTGAYIGGCLYAWAFHGLSFAWLFVAGIFLWILCIFLQILFRKTVYFSDRRYYFLFPLFFLLAGWNMTEALRLSTVWQQEGQKAAVCGVVEKKERKANSDVVVLENGWVYQIGDGSKEGTGGLPEEDALGLSKENAGRLPGEDALGLPEKGIGGLQAESPEELSVQKKEAPVWKAGSGKLLVYIDKTEDIFSGDTLCIQGETAFFERARNPGQFDMEKYYKNKGIASMLYGKTVEKRGEGLWLFRCLDRLRNAFSEFYEKALPQKEAGTVISMFLGDKSCLDAEIKELYQHSGIAHILAISGLHISLLGMSLYRLLLASGRYRQTACVITILFLLCYGVLTGFSVSATRAILMTSVALFGEIIGRAYDLLSGLSFAALCILLPSPMQLFDMGFQLSFLAVAGIALFYPYVKSLLLRQEKEREEEAGKKGKELWYQKRRLRQTLLSESQKRRRRFLLALSDALFSCFFLNLFTAPVLLWHSYEIPAYAVFLNVLVLPLVSLLLGLSVVGGLVGLFVFPAGVFLMGGVHTILSYYESLCGKISRLPGASYLTGRPSAVRITGCLLCFLLLFFLYFLWKKTDFGKKKLRWMAVAALMGVLIFLFFPKNREGLHITMLDVGQGDALCLQLGESCCFIDGGSSSEKEIGKYILKPFLDFQGIRTVDYWFFSHMDADHVSGFLELAENPYFQGRIQNVVLPKLQKKDEAYEELKAAARRAGCRILYFSDGDALSFPGESTRLACLFPENGKEYPDRNDSSMVLSLTRGNFSALFMGDLGMEGEERLLQMGRLPKKITLLKAGHHGSKTSSGEDFLQNEAPKFTFISCGEKNRYGHPHAETLRRLSETGSRIYQSKECGAVTMTVYYKSIGLETVILPDTGAVPGV